MRDDANSNIRNFTGVDSLAAYSAALYPGVGAGYAASQIFAGTVYGYLANSSLQKIPEILKDFSMVNTKNNSFRSTYKPILKIGAEVVPQFAGEKIKAASDVFSSASSIANSLNKKTNK